MKNAVGRRQHDHAGAALRSCTSGAMTSTSTNLHFHGMTVPRLPSGRRAEDLDSIRVPPFEYRFRIPADEPPGLYWYHPHIHGFSRAQVLGGASGALIVEGMERAVRRRRTAGARPGHSRSGSDPSGRGAVTIRTSGTQMLIDRDGDSANNGTGFGDRQKISRSTLFRCPIRTIPPPTFVMQPGQREVWRVLNACAITYLNLAVLFDRAPQQLGHHRHRRRAHQSSRRQCAACSMARSHRRAPGRAGGIHRHAPPSAGRTHCWSRAPSIPDKAARTIRTAPLASIAERSGARTAFDPACLLRTGARPRHAVARRCEHRCAFAGCISRRSCRTRPIPTARPSFYLTVDGQTPAPSIRVPMCRTSWCKQGDVEDWIIENRSSELHAFHIHQIHFLLLDCRACR